MINVRNAAIGAVASAIVAVVAVSCGGGGGYGGGGDAGVVTYTVGGTLAGSTGTVVIKLNGGNDVSMSADGPFTMGAVPAGGTYNVQIAAPNQRCTVSDNGAGTMGAANVTGVTITCAAQTNQTVVRTSVLTGALQNPPVVTSATGVGGVVVDPTDTDVNGNIAITGGMTFSGLTPTLGGHHIHQAPIGDPTNNGPVIIGLTLAADGQTAVVPPNTRLTPAQYTALLAGELYFNVHTVANPVGEIRGQIVLQGGVISGVAALNATQEVDANGATTSVSTATGSGTVIVDRATRTILISYMTHNVASPAASHIHTSVNPNPPCAGGPTCNGPVIINFSTTATLNYPAVGAQMSPQNVTDLLANYLYFNIHSGNLLCGPGGNASCAGGEIRGNITAIP
jgi:CHRD domain-containing protein